MWKYIEYGNNFQLLWSNYDITETEERNLSHQCEEDLDELHVVCKEEFADVLQHKN
jgi:hypothetical protein